VAANEIQETVGQLSCLCKLTVHLTEVIELCLRLRAQPDQSTGKSAALGSLTIPLFLFDEQSGAFPVKIVYKLKN